MSDNSFKDLFPLVREVGEKLLTLWPGGGNQNLKIWNKTNDTPVTEADLLANDLLVTGLKKLFPDDGIISEESELDPTIRADKPVWFIDPLDGTRSFIAGKDDFSILMGRCEKGRATSGIMYFPAQGFFAWAQKGQGAFLNDKPLKVSNSTDFKDGGLYCRAEDLKIGAHLFTDKLDSGRAFLGVANSEFDGAIMRLGSFGAHDFAAPSIMIEEAGGEVSDEKGNKDLFYPNGFNLQYFVASNKKLHSSILSLIPV